MTRLATSIMIFAVIRQSLDHSEHKNRNNPNTLSIDEKTQYFCFILTLLFFLDFVSAWFDQYSKYFAGDRYDKVAYSMERAI